MLNPTSPLPLRDPTLFRQANCIDGKWVQPYEPGRGFLYDEMSALLGVTR